MKIATFNCNSVRQRLPLILDWLADNEPDILALQETKVEDDKFPRFDFEEMGWQVAVHGQKSYNGVAFVTREPLARVMGGFGDPAFPEDRRILTTEFKGLRIANTYVPNGTKVGSDKFEYKLRWMDRLRKFLADNRIDVWLGDINIAPKPEDVYDSKRVLGGVGHHPAEFERIEAIRGDGWVDLFRTFTEGPGHYTYWDYFIKTAFERNNGWRIDHIYARGEAAARCTKCVIDVEPRRHEKPSDHTVVWAEFA